MKITYDTTKEDYWNFNKYVMFKNPKMRISIFSSIFLFILIVFIGIFIYTDSLIYSIVTTILATLIFVIITQKSTKRRIINLVENEDGILGEHTIEINKDELKEYTKNNSSSWNWNGIKSIEDNEDYIFIFINNLLGHVIPKRGFNSQEECKKFYNLAKEYHEETKN